MDTETNTDGTQLNLAELWDRCGHADAPTPITSATIRELFKRENLANTSAPGFTHLARCMSAMLRDASEDGPLDRRWDHLALRLKRAVDELAAVLPAMLELAGPKARQIDIAELLAATIARQNFPIERRSPVFWLADTLLNPASRKGWEIVWGDAGPPPSRLQTHNQ